MNIWDDYEKARQAIREIAERYGHRFVSEHVEEFYADQERERRQGTGASSPPAHSFAPEDVWYRSFLSPEECRTVIQSTGLSLGAQIVSEESLLLTLAKTLDLGVGEVLFRQRGLSQKKADAYLAAFTDLVLNRATLEGLRNAPPKPPGTWMRATMEWAEHQATEAKGAGRPTDIGYDEFFRLVLRFYEWAFQRPPAATPAGPTFRFCRTLWDIMASKDADPKWRQITDRAIIDRINSNKRAPAIYQRTGTGSSSFSPHELYRNFVESIYNGELTKKD
jgi:hypothetical protein